jgi:type I phosphodiesterase/nucleotide pyrophosphatase
MSNEELRMAAAPLLHSTFDIRHSSFKLLGLFILAACTATTSPAPQPPTPPPPPRLTSAHAAQRVILVSFDGLSADAMAKFGAPAFERMTAHARVVPVTPTETSSTHAAILTGLPPDVTGIVSNQFHKRGTPPDEVAKGLTTDIEGETLVDAARRAGKRAGCINFPFFDLLSPRRTCDFGIAWNANLTRSRIIHLGRGDFHAEWLPPAWGAPAARHASFSPVMRARIEWSVPNHAREEADLAAYDTTNDNARNYDTFYVETRGGESRLDAQGWFSMSTRLEDGLYGTWSKVLHADAALDSVTIYLGPVSHTNAYPASFRDALDMEAGFSPATPDEPSARDWLAGSDGIDPATFAEEADRLAGFLTRATLFAMKREPFDLLLSYDPILDETEHQFAIENEKQLYGTPEHIAAAERTLRAAYAAFDRSVNALTAAVDPTRDAIVITGDHGYAPFDTEVRLNAMLPAGWRAYVNGHAAHLYRFSGDADVVDLLTNLRSPDGAAVFESVTRHTATSHPNAGDVIASTFPRFALSNAAGPLFAKVANYGQHGALNSHPELNTTLGASGVGITPQRIDVMPQTDVAPFVKTLLGISAAPRASAPARP